ncbi:MAG: NAD(P)-binding protein [Phycisphaerae bacterium]
MTTRREFLGRGFSAVAAGLAVNSSWALPLFKTASRGTRSQGVRGPSLAGDSAPVAPIALSPDSMVVDGIRFARWFTGDDFPEIGAAHLPIPPFVAPYTAADLPVPSETVDVCVVGGGLSGLSAAYMLRDFRPVLLDPHQRFGGNARGEDWAGNKYSLGSAYVITPDPGSYLEELYTELGLDQVFRISGPPDPIAVHGRIIEDFWTAGGSGKLSDAAAFADYAGVVNFMADDSYPDIPFDTGDPDNEWIVDLDRTTFKQDLQSRMTHDIPPLLEQAVQAYCFSSFGARWDEISAAAGWNFLAAEEFDRWVFPGGVSYMAQMFWRELRRIELDRPGIGGPMLRNRSLVVDVRLVGDLVQVTYVDGKGTLQSLLARRVVMACPKFVCKRIMHGIETADHAKFSAMATLQYTAYLIANVLLDRQLDSDFYDIFLLNDDAQPPSPDGDNCATRPVADLLNGDYTDPNGTPRSVLTLYWPVPGHWMRYCMAYDSPYERFTQKILAQIDGILGVVGADRSDIAQIRLSRWGHALPVAAPNLIAEGIVDHLRRPFEGKVYFVNQDNWALPAVENSLLDARTMTDQVREDL